MRSMIGWVFGTRDVFVHVQFVAKFFCYLSDIKKMCGVVKSKLWFVLKHLHLNIFMLSNGFAKVTFVRCTQQAE